MGLGGTTTILVTGAAGFLGSHLVDALLKRGHEVVGLDNLMTGSLDNLRRASRDLRFRFVAGDVRDPPPVHAEVVFNLACPASPIHYQAAPLTTFESSVLGALRLAERTAVWPMRIVQASTSEVYGDPLEHPQREEYAGNVRCIGPRACYDEGKRAAETILTDLRRTRGVDVRIARIFNTYGPRMALDDGRVVSNFLAAVVRRKPLFVYGSGTQTRSFCYVEDLVEGLVSLGLAPTIEHEVVNLGNPTEITVAELAELARGLVDDPPPVEHHPLPVDDPTRRCPDISRARKLLGFAPRISVETGLAATYEDFARRLAGAT